MIPTVEQCYVMMERYEMLENIRAHSIMVERAARVIAGELKNSGMDISLRKVIAGALMHDIGKTMCLNTREDHAVKGSEICIANNFSEISEVVREHVIMKSFIAEGGITEKEIIYYADKRVNHDRVVSIDERMKDLFLRYAKGNRHMEKLIEENFEVCRKVEKKLFTKINFKPDELAEKIKVDAGAR